MTRTAFVLAGALAIATIGPVAMQAQQSRPQGYLLGDPYRLSGTYQIDWARSDRPQQVINQLTRALPAQERDFAFQELADRLDPPETLAIDLRGRVVTMMSSNTPRVSFEIDGRDRVESFPGGGQATLHADIYGDELTISARGITGSDFTARFEPIQGGLRVTRQVDSESLRRPVTAYSVYRRVSDNPRWDLYGDAVGRIVIPEGTRLFAQLNQRLSARDLRDGDAFTMTVARGPYRGAVINGWVAAGRGRQGLAVEFDRVRMNNGRVSDFEGRIEAVRAPDGGVLRVEGGGVARNRDRVEDAVRNGAIGAAIGAIVGAIAGGGKGAAIGAVAGGAGLILIGDRPDASLPAGTEFTIVSMRPRYGNVR